MKVPKGGTDLWYPACKATRTCKSIPAAQITGNVRDYKQRWHFTKHQDINWFQRGRRCLTCDHKFVTGEVTADMARLDQMLRAAASYLSVRLPGVHYEYRFGTLT